MEKANILIENDEQVSEESKSVIDQVTEDVSKKIEEEKNDDGIVPPTTSKLIDEQENVIDTNTTVPAIVSPSRANLPLKEVNESATILNDPENINTKKRELNLEDEQIQEKILANDERTGDQTKKIKISESIDTPIVETKGSDNNIVVEV